MAFVVEDGTGLENANSYISIDEFKDYWTDRNVDYSTKTDTEIQASLIKATQYIDNNYVFIGYKNNYNQGLEFPRYNALDRNGYLVVDIPKCLKYAICEASAININGADLFASSEDGITEKTENVGPVETTYKYKNKSTGMIVYQVITRLLKPILKSNISKILRY